MKSRKIFAAVLFVALAFPAFGQWDSNLSTGEGFANFEDIWVGPFTSYTTGEGSRLYLNGFAWCGHSMFLQRINSAGNHDLRINVGDERAGFERFLIGNKTWHDNFAAWESWLSVLSNGKVGIGTDTPYYKLDVNGTLRAKEIKVNLNSGADFVFDAGYRLKPLDEVSSFIRENRHLPEIPPADEMTAGDTDLGALQVKLLQKIEELTLYVIQQNEEIQSLKSEINGLKTAK